MTAKTKAIVEDLKKGKLNLVDLAEKHEVSRQYIQQVGVAYVPNYKAILKKLRKERAQNLATEKEAMKAEARQGRTQDSEERTNKASLLWRAGLSIEQIAAILELTKGSTYMLIHRLRNSKGTKMFPFRKERKAVKA